MSSVTRVLLGMILVLSGALFASFVEGTNAGNNYEERLAELEERMEDLESQVRVLQMAVGAEDETSPSETDDKVFALTGQVVLKRDYDLDQSNPNVVFDDQTGTCRGSGRDSDVQVGVQVTVIDETGKTIGHGNLGSGTFTLKNACTFAFSVALPLADLYTVRLPFRGEAIYTHQELVEAGWSIILTLE